MRRFVYIGVIFILLGGIVLTAYAPDEISMIFIVIMEGIVLAGSFFGIFQVAQFYRGFETGLTNIERAQEVQSSSAWTSIQKMDDFFRQKTMDRLFVEYREKVIAQQDSGQILGDIDEFINDEILAMHSWQNLMHQVPGTLTGLGIMGTFIGLIIGIRGVAFSSVNAALISVQTLLDGIQVAFYTSIAGVILSLLFNFLYRFTWNIMMRNMNVFLDSFHKQVIPPVEEQLRYRERREINQITELLERLPKNTGYSVSAGGQANPVSGSNPQNEQILMPQILHGLKDGDFIFQLQPHYDLNSRKVLGAEALVRWNHGKLGMVSPAVFIPVLESNGYITRLDQYIWEKVCATIREWIDRGIRPVPLAVNVTKTDILAMDVSDFFLDMLKKYRIPPRSLEIEIAENAYLQSGHTAVETEEKLRANGFRVVVDGFNGDYIALSAVEGIQADLFKLDLRRFAGAENQNALNAVFAQARKLNMNLGAEGIESMEQLGMLRKSGCTEGQGFFLSKPLSIEEFETLMREEKA